MMAIWSKWTGPCLLRRKFKRHSVHNLNNSFFTKRPKRTWLRFSLRLICEETSYFNVFEQVTLSDVGEELIGVSYICVCNAG